MCHGMDVSMGFFFPPFGVLWVSLICRLMSFIKFRGFSEILFKYFFCVLLSPLSGTPITWILGILVWPHNFLILYCCFFWIFSSVSSVAQSCLTLCNPMDCSTQGFPVHYQLPELAQTRPSSQWCNPTISTSVIPFASCLRSFPASKSFPRSQLFASGGQSIGVSASTSVLPMNIQDGFPLGWTGWIFLLSKGLSRVFSNTTVQKHQFFGAQLSL